MQQCRSTLFRQSGWWWGIECQVPRSHVCDIDSPTLDTYWHAIHKSSLCRNCFLGQFVFLQPAGSSRQLASSLSIGEGGARGSRKRNARRFRDSGCQLASLAACLDSLVTLLQIFQSAPFGLSYPLTQSAHYEETVFLSEYVVIN